MSDLTKNFLEINLETTKIKKISDLGIYENQNCYHG